MMKEHIQVAKRKRKYVTDAKEELLGITIPDQPVQPDYTNYQHIHRGFYMSGHLI